MLAYSTQDLILEPSPACLFGFTPGESTQLAGCSTAARWPACCWPRWPAGAWPARAWLLRLTIGGCLASALALLGLVLADHWAPHWPLRANVFVLGRPTARSRSPPSAR